MPEILQMDSEHLKNLIDRYIIILDGLESWNDNCPCGCQGCQDLMAAIDRARIIQLSDLSEA
jgi:hypothetical protein